MVEMRWVERKPYEGFERMPGITDSVGMIRILQYRVLVDATPITTETQVLPFPFSIQREWSKWMDVPVQAA